MRNWKLALALLGCTAVVGCAGSSDEEPADTGTGMQTPVDMGTDNATPSIPAEDGSSDPAPSEGGEGIEIPEDGESSGGDPYPECPREMVEVPPPYAGTGPAWTQEEFMACQQMCGMDQTCFNEENCPGIDEFDLCANSEIFQCSAVAGGTCRVEYENVVCCINIAGCAPDDQACAETNCGQDIAAMQQCITNDIPCLQQAVGGCLGPAPAAGTMTIPADAASTPAFFSRELLTEQAMLQTVL